MLATAVVLSTASRFLLLSLHNRVVDPLRSDASSPGRVPLLIAAIVRVAIVVAAIAALAYVAGSGAR